MSHTLHASLAYHFCSSSYQLTPSDFSGGFHFSVESNQTINFDLAGFSFTRVWDWISGLNVKQLVWYWSRYDTDSIENGPMHVLIKITKSPVFRVPKCTRTIEQQMYCHQVPPRFELGSLDSKSRVLTITPWDLAHESWRSFRPSNFISKYTLL